MKKILLLFGIISFGTSVFAQGVKYGVKGGFNFADFRGHDADSDIKTDIYLGGYVRIRLTETMAFQPELVYSRQGSKDKEDGAETKIKTNYLNIPLLLCTKMFGSENLIAVVGTQIGMHLSSEVSEGNGPNEISEDIDELLADFDYAFALGLEYDIDESVTIGARYNMGLTKMFKKDYLTTDVRNSVFQIGVAFAF